MNILKMACLSLAVTGAGLIANADPEIVPHRGLWKNYSNSKVAENSIESYKRVKDKKFNGKTPTYTEFDTRVAKINTDSNAPDIYDAIVYHDNFWDRLTDYQSDTGDWGLKAFQQELPQINSLSIGMSTTEFSQLYLRRSKSGGLTTVTNDRPLRLKDFILATACDYDPIIILDVQTSEIANKVSQLLLNQSCPSHTAYSGSPFTDRVHVKLFATATINGTIWANSKNADGSVNPQKVATETINYYGSDIKYWIQFNSSQFKTSCSGSTCDLRFGSSYFNAAEYLAGVLSSSSVQGVAFSKPGIYQDTDPTHTDALSDQLDTLFAQSISYNNAHSNDKKSLMAIAQRPEDYIIWKSKGRNGTAATRGKKNNCFPFIYRGDGLGIIFYSPKVFQDRNFFASDSRFDYVVADGYVDTDGKIGYDTATDIRRMCGSDTWIATKFIIDQHDSDAEQQSDYFSFVDETNDYFWLDTIKGTSAIEIAYD